MAGFQSNAVAGAGEGAAAIQVGKSHTHVVTALAGNYERLCNCQARSTLAHHPVRHKLTAAGMWAKALAAADLQQQP